MVKVLDVIQSSTSATVVSMVLVDGFDHESVVAYGGLLQERKSHPPNAPGVRI